MGVKARGLGGSRLLRSMGHFASLCPALLKAFELMLESHYLSLEMAE